MPDKTDIERPSTTSEFMTDQANDPYCMEVANTVGKPVFMDSNDMNKVLIKPARIDGALQKFLSTSLRASILYLATYHVLPGDRGERRHYGTMSYEYYWPHMPNGAYKKGADSQSCSGQGTRPHQNQLCLFLSAGTLDFLATDILGPLPKTNFGNQHEVVLNARYKKLSRVKPLTTVTSTRTATVLLEI